MSVIPSCYIPSIKNLIFNFIWNKKPDRIKRDVMTQDYVDGGLRVPNVEFLFKALNLAWISRLLLSDDNFPATWKSIADHFFAKYGGLNFLLRCNYDRRFLEKSDLPLFYKQMLLNFLELKLLYTCSDESELLLFNNKDIVIDGSPFCMQIGLKKECF